MPLLPQQQLASMLSAIPIYSFLHHPDPYTRFLRVISPFLQLDPGLFYVNVALGGQSPVELLALPDIRDFLPRGLEQEILSI